MEAENAICVLLGSMDGISEEDIIIKVMKVFDVSKEYVLEILAPQKA